MKKLMLSQHILAAFILLALSMPSMAADIKPQPWQQLYTGAEATGENVIALWQFLPGQETRDNSGHGHDLTLRGQARYVKEGPFGASLESFAAGTNNDKPQGAVAKNHPDLTPLRAFTIEAWLMAKPEMDKCDSVFLLDKKYYSYAKEIPQANWDYCLYLNRTGQNQRRLMASLGFGKDSAFVASTDFPVEPGKWMHVAFTYDGAGRCRFFVNGKPFGRTNLEGRGPVTAGQYDLVIGDRFGSTHSGFPGYVAQVRISKGIVPCFTGSIEVKVAGGRTAFVRMEKNAAVPVTVYNDSDRPLIKVTAELIGGIDSKIGIRNPQSAIDTLAPNQSHTFQIPVDTSLRPGSYQRKVLVSAAAADKKLQIEKELPVVIVPRPLLNQMPVVLWGDGELKRVKEIGFTHQLVSLIDYGKVWEAGKPTAAMSTSEVEQQGKMLDDYLKEGMGAVVYLYPGSWVVGNQKLKPKYQRVDRSGKMQTPDNVCGNFPEVRDFTYSAGASVAQTFGQFPALQGALIHSEVRDESSLCFHDQDKEAFRKYAGYDIPTEALGKSGVHFSRFKDFPPRHVVPDDDHILNFYRWFWKDGDGWNPLHTQVHKGLKSTGRNDLWTFYDPAVRVPDIWGSGGGVDVISQWTYSYPDPIKIGQAADELFAMAEGSPGQKVMKMTQIIWYRSGTAPIADMPKDEAKRAQWEKEKPEAPFITIAPDHLREAFWSEISRPVRGIMNHGWESLVDTGSKTGYVYTNPETKDVLAELIRNVVRPLGPTLLQVPDRKSDVGILESFTSQMFAGRGTYGWSEWWEASMHLILQWAHLQPKILFDETVLRDGLDGYRVLVMPYCDVLTESVVGKVKEFQRKGGIVVADEFLTPAIIPDIVIPSYKRTGKADEDKAALQAKSADLRKELDTFYQRYGDASNPDVVVRFRQYGSADYLFALNDKRTFGDYVGQYGKVMEKGLPNAATLTVARANGFVYDLVEHKPVTATIVDKRLRFDANFGPGGGRVFLITDRKIAGLRLEAPTRAQLGKPVSLNVAIIDDKEAPVSAVIPVQVEIIDPQGRLAEFSGNYGAKDGKLSIHLDLAANDPAGTWTIKVRELASGLSREQKVAVRS